MGPGNPSQTPTCWILIWKRSGIIAILWCYLCVVIFVAKYNRLSWDHSGLFLNPLISTLMYTLVLQELLRYQPRESLHNCFYLSGIVCLELFCILLKWHIIYLFKQCRNFFGKVYFRSDLFLQFQLLSRQWCNLVYKYCCFPVLWFIIAFQVIIFK